VNDKDRLMVMNEVVEAFESSNRQAFLNGLLIGFFITTTTFIALIALTESTRAPQEKPAATTEDH
jgi:hypothetical protein